MTDNPAPGAASAGPVRVEHHQRMRTRPGLVIVRRPSRLGNPYRSGDRAADAAAHSAWLAGGGPDVIEHPGPNRVVRYDRNYVLSHLHLIAQAAEVGCACPLGGGPCHGDTLIYLATGKTPPPAAAQQPARPGRRRRHTPDIERPPADAPPEEHDTWARRWLAEYESARRVRRGRPRTTAETERWRELMDQREQRHQKATARAQQRQGRQQDGDDR